MRNETEIAGPVRLAAVEAVIVKMPAPITTDTPKTVRSRQLRSRRSLVSGSSVSAIDCSTVLVRLLLVVRGTGSVTINRPLFVIVSAECTHYRGFQWPNE